MAESLHYYILHCYRLVCDQKNGCGLKWKCVSFEKNLITVENAYKDVTIYDDEMRIQNHIHRLRPYVNLSNRFYYYVLWLWKQIGLIGGQGIGLQGFSSKAIHNLIIPLPPLNEQNRITHMIDELLGFLDTIEQHLS